MSKTQSRPMTVEVLPKTQSKEKVTLEEEDDPWAGLPKHLRNKKKVTYIRNHRLTLSFTSFRNIILND